jgi:hypothetical protein
VDDDAGRVVRVGGPQLCDCRLEPLGVGREGAAIGSVIELQRRAVALRRAVERHGREAVADRLREMRVAGHVDAEHARPATGDVDDQR